MPFPVKNFLSTDTGLGAFTTTSGDFVDKLSKCLVDGFNVTTPTAVAYNSGNSNFTITLPAGHGYRVNQILLLSGANESGYNVEMRVDVAGATELTLQSHADETKPVAASATGTFSLKAAPQGTWTKPYTGTNKAVFKINEVGSSLCSLRVDNSSAISSSYGLFVYVDGYETMSSVDVGTNQFGVFTAGNNVWGVRGKTSYIDSPWLIVSDNSAFQLFIKLVDSATAGLGDLSETTKAHYWTRYFFGDMARFAANDVYCCALLSAGATAATTIAYDCATNGSVGSRSWLLETTAVTTSGLSLSRNLANDVGKANITWFSSPWVNSSATPFLSGIGSLTYPQAGNNSLVLVKEGLKANASQNQIRAGFPGDYFCIQSVGGSSLAIAPCTVVTYSNKKLLTTYFFAHYTTSGRSNTYSAVAFIDITGPWR